MFSDSWGKNILAVIYPWDIFPGGRGGSSFHRRYLSEGQLCMQQIIQKAVFLRGSLQGDIVREQ